MKSDKAAVEEEDRRKALQHIEGAHHQLKVLRDRIGILEGHPELREAITQLEVALSILAVNTGGML